MKGERVCSYRFSLIVVIALSTLLFTSLSLGDEKSRRSRELNAPVEVVDHQGRMTNIENREKNGEDLSSVHDDKSSDPVNRTDPDELIDQIKRLAREIGPSAPSVANERGSRKRPEIVLEQSSDQFVNFAILPDPKGRREGKPTPGEVKYHCYLASSDIETHEIRFTHLVSLSQGDGALFPKMKNGLVIAFGYPDSTSISLSLLNKRDGVIKAKLTGLIVSPKHWLEIDLGSDADRLYCGPGSKEKVAQKAIKNYLERLENPKQQLPQDTVPYTIHGNSRFESRPSHR